LERARESEEEAILGADLPICDAHHHLWNRPEQRYMFGEFLNDATSGHNVRSSVFVEWRSHYRESGPTQMRPVGETEFASAVGESAANRPIKICAAIVGYADLSLGSAVARVLEAHLEAGRGRFKGIRNVATWDPDPQVLGGPPICDPGLYRQPRFREGFALLEGYGLTFDAWVYQTQLDELIDLARAFPRQDIVLNHTGGVLGIGGYAGRRDELFASWLNGLHGLARCPNVRIKLGGLGMRRSGFDFYGHAQDCTSQTAAAAWRPWIEACLAEFGADRCMFESNFPVDGASCSYRVLWNAFKRLIGGASATEKSQVLHDTAANFYGLAREPGLEQEIIE
jgi:L-fuconolactonase